MSNTNKTVLQEPRPTAAPGIGSIAAAELAGFHGPLLLPIAPFDATGNVSPGKTPAVMRSDGSWVGLKKWNGGTSAVTREACDAAGANCGLILGHPNDHQQFIALDFDLEGADMAVVLEARALALATIVATVGDVYVRDTREGRAAVLLRIPHAEAAGSKHVAHLTHPVHGGLGKIELLTKGQQIVVSGIHNKTRKRMLWWRTDTPGTMLPAPIVGTHIPILTGRAAVDSLLDLVLTALGTIGITHTRSKTHDPDTAASNHTSPAEKAAPSVAALLEILQGLPNPASADRDVYLAVMHGTAGCIRAARTLTPKITRAEEDQVARAAAAWAARWESGTSSSEADEEAKFRADFLKADNIYAGWRTLVATATDLGWDGAAAIDAGAYFDAVKRTDEEEAAEAEKAETRAEGEAAKKLQESLGPRQRLPSVKFLSLNSVANLPPQEWLIEDIVPAASLICAYGMPKAGKTFLLLSMLLHVAARKDWMGKPTRQGAVVYIVGEGARGLQKRLEAMKQHYGIGDEAPFYVVGRAVNFMDPKAVRELGEDIEDLLAAEGQTLAAIAVDTVARAIPGADENSSKEMGMFILGCDQLRESLKCTVFAIHHAGKDLARGARGSSALLGAVDAQYVIERRKDGVTTLTVTDMRDGASGEVMTFDMLPVSTSDGKSSLVPVLRAAAAAAQGAAPAAPAKPLVGDQAVAFGALEEALKKTGKDQSSGTRACTVAAWRAVYYGRRSGDGADAMEKGFKRSRTALLGKGLIEVNDPYVWVRTAWSAADDFTALERAAEIALLAGAEAPAGPLN
jgi:hypothetical protein